jgi:hypothetical protein
MRSLIVRPQQQNMMNSPKMCTYTTIWPKVVLWDGPLGAAALFRARCRQKYIQRPSLQVDYNKAETVPFTYSRALVSPPGHLLGHGLQ